MSKKASAGRKAGAISAIPVGLAWAIVALRVVSIPSSVSVSNAHTFIMIASASMILMSGVFAAVIGAIAGLLFVETTNKLPIQSVYVKAVIPVVIVGSLYLLGVSLNSMLFHVKVLEILGVTALSTLLFAYLFNRWSR